MNQYRHLSQIERYQIQVLLAQSVPLTVIAKQLNRHRSTLYREIKRSVSPPLVRTSSGISSTPPSSGSTLLGSGVPAMHGTYAADVAQGLYQRRAQSSRNARRIEWKIWHRIERYLLDHLSPEQAALRLKLEYDESISPESIYLHTYRYACDEVRSGCLRRKRKARKKREISSALNTTRGAINNRRDIQFRPDIVQAKSRIGDFEGDTIVGRMHLGGILTLVDRYSRYTFAAPLNSRQCTPTAQAIIDLLGPYSHQIHTITLDNGSEFALHERFAAALGAEVYFAKPHSPWQRGLNENTNGLMRQYFPKGSSLRDLQPQQVQFAVDKLNHRPRKCLNGRTPHEVFFNLPTPKLTI